jgi:Baculovirus U-box/Ring-like domain
MLLTLRLNDKEDYLYRLFKALWKEYTIECKICFDNIDNDGIVAITDYHTINLEKMFHSDCLKRWQRERTHDPFNRNVKFYFTFPPQNKEECLALLKTINDFIGDDDVDQRFRDEYKRVYEEPILDIEIDLLEMLKC